MVSKIDRKIIEELREKAISASLKSHSPYSQAQVGSAIKLKSGKIYSGCNIENSSFGGTVCAERVAIWKSVSENSNDPIEVVYVYTKDGWPPCGLCLQVIVEFASANCTIITGNAQGEESKYQLQDLLPIAFTPDKLTKHSK